MGSHERFEKILSKVKSKYWERSHKFGIRIPKSIQEAINIDKENGDTLWTDAIAEEMNKVMIAFELYDDSISSLIGYKQLHIHMIFDIRMGENFRRKARLVADGHRTKVPASSTYSTVVSRDSVCICFMIAALNNLDLLAADVENAYLNAPCREKHWIKAGPEFGSNEGRTYIVVRALYGLRSSGAAFRAYMAEILDGIGFKSSIADPDVWLRMSIKSDGEKYYEYILIYVDDILCISADPNGTMIEISNNIKFKKNKVAPPEMYLGATIQQRILNGQKCWTMSSITYVKAAIENVAVQLKERKMKFNNKAVTPIHQGYKPELDQSQLLNSADITFFQELIGMLRWAIEIGRVDIYHEVSILSTYQAAPRLGHLEQLIHIFSYLKKQPKTTLYFDPALPKYDESIFQGSPMEDFKELYRDAKEAMPNNAPPSLGKIVTMTAFVDASHAANTVTRRSHTGFIIFANRAPIYWYSKKQSTVETSTFSSEFIALKTCMEQVTALRYKLHMFGIELDGPTNIFCDNKTCVSCASNVEATLNKKHSSLAYHACKYAVAAGIIKVTWINTNDNIADPLTKQLTVQKRAYLFGNWTY